MRAHVFVQFRVKDIAVFDHLFVFHCLLLKSVFEIFHNPGSHNRIVNTIIYFLETLRILVIGIYEAFRNARRPSANVR